MMVRQRFGGIFQKYLLVLFMAVAIPLAINGVIEAGLGYRDQRANSISCSAFRRRPPQSTSKISSTALRTSLTGWSSFRGLTTPTSGGELTHYVCFAKPLPS